MASAPWGRFMDPVDAELSDHFCTKAEEIGLEQCPPHAFFGSVDGPIAGAATWSGTGICLNRALYEAPPALEEFVIAHELGHWVLLPRQHTLLIGVACLLAVLIIWKTWNVTSCLGSLAAIGGQVTLYVLLFLGFSVWAEYSADQFALQYADPPYVLRKYGSRAVETLGVRTSRLGPSEVQAQYQEQERQCKASLK